MSRINQPICQVRLTNVAVVKLKTHGKRFEIACYRNKVVNFRSGIEVDLDEVLQTKSIFQNVSKGQLANKDDLQKAFGISDEEIICRRILEKGELQVSDRERQAVLDAVFRDVCTVVASKCVNPRTGLPVTVTGVESAMKECGFAVKWSEPAKKQALRAIELLRRELPDQIARAQMSLRITCGAESRDELRTFLVDSCQATVEKENLWELPAKCASSNSSTAADHHPTAAAAAAAARAVSETDTVNKACQRYAEFQLVCDPAYYRQLDDFVNNALKPTGTLQLMSANAKKCAAVQDRQEDSSCIHTAISRGHSLRLGEQMRRLDESSKSVAATGRRDDTLVGGGGGGGVLSTASCGGACGSTTSTGIGLRSSLYLGAGSGMAATERTVHCSTCEEKFKSSYDYRKHCQSQWHSFNVKRKVKGQLPVGEVEFLELSEDLRRGFLAVDP